jgi:hypothetical protein
VQCANLALCNSNRIILAWARRRWHSFEADAVSIGIDPWGGLLWKCAIENSRAPEAGHMAVPSCIHLFIEDMAHVLSRATRRNSTSKVLASM